LKRILLSLGIVIVLVAGAGLAKPLQKEAGPRFQNDSEIQFNHSLGLSKTAVDTTYLLGGPDRWDGSFEIPGGLADWQGWTHEDVSIPIENHWHVSTYLADQIPGHGPGNHAMYCGDETIPACSPSDTTGGYGHGWDEEIEWRQTVGNPWQPLTVRLTGAMTFHTEGGYDYVYLSIQRGETLETLVSWDGQGAVALDQSTTLNPGDFSGPGSDEVRLVWRFRSDGGHDDEDCAWPTRGACQIDDLAVYFDDILVTLDDFEPENPVNWILVEPTAVVGDFANLRNNLQSVHPCQSVNMSYQANFIDDGIVVPGTGGTPCITWCYGPGGWIINNDGGLTQDTSYHIINRVISPPLAWLADSDGAELAFDVFVHENFGVPNPSGIFPFWWVRSTSSTDPADLQNAPWVHSNLGLTDNMGSYLRKIYNVTDMMVPDRQWAQVALGIYEFGFLYSIDGPNGTPAPYYDNVAFKVWDPDGPAILIKPQEVFGDSSPESGILDPVNLAVNSCRVDRAAVINVNSVFTRGDSLITVITPLRHGAEVAAPPLMHWVMQCNPVFDSVRPGAPDPQSQLRGMVSGGVVLNNLGDPKFNTWSFDLPDTGFFYPGDRLRYYVTASDDLAGDIRTSVWPPDTTGVTDFSPGSAFPFLTEIRGLPTVTQPVADQFVHPSTLYVDDSRADHQVRSAWLEALEDLGLEYGDNLDILTIHFESDFSQFMTADILAGYETMLYSSGTSFSSMDHGGPSVVDDWLDTGQKKLLMAGENLMSRMENSNDGSLLGNRLGGVAGTSNITGANGNIWDLLVSPSPGNSVFPEDIQWQVNAACPKIRFIDAIGTVASGQSAAALEGVGNPGGDYSAAITTEDLVLENRTVVVPFDLDAISGMTVLSGKSDKNFSPSTYLAYFLLTWLGSDVVSGADDVPGVGKLTVNAHPNPFNPTTTIAFELPRAMEVSLHIYDLQGRLVRRLLDENPFATGSHKQIWDGRNGDGRATGSGVYFYKFTAGDQDRVGKLTLLK
jgi:hypothetical protein